MICKMLDMSIRPCTQIVNFLSCLPYIGIGFIVGQALVIEGTATAILQDRDVFTPRGQAMNQDQKNYILVSYGNMGVRVGVQGLLTTITAIAFTILGITGLAMGIVWGSLGCAAMALSCYQIHRVNQYLEQHPPDRLVFVS
jgi:hypothetical protein